MRNDKQKDGEHFDVLIGPGDWSKEQIEKAKAFVEKHHAQRTPGRKLKNEMLTITYRMEAYVDNEKITEKQIVSMEEFLHQYLTVLNISFRRFAQAIDTTDANLKKYLSGDRKFTTDLAFKFSNFFHTTPDLWMKVNLKNELLNLKKERKEFNKYKKYDYEKLVG